MSISLPSKRFAFVDVPEVTTFTADFVYNFFTADEKVNDSGNVPVEFIQDRPAANFDTKFINSINFNRFTPRLVKFSWKPVVDQQRVEKGKSNPNITKISIKDNLQKIHNEQTFTTDDFVNIYIQDNNADQKLNFFVKRLLDETINRETQVSQKSPMDTAKFLKKKTDSRIDQNFVTKVFFNAADNGYRFLDDRGRIKKVDSLIDEITQVRVRTQLNSKVAATLLKTTKENTLNLFDDEAEKLLNEAQQVQQEAISQKNSSILDGRDYDFEVLEFIDYKKVDPNAFNPTVEIIGYVIDKQELTREGNIIEHSPIIIENPNANSAADLKVRYGSTYIYTIRAIAYIELAAEDTETNSVIGLSFLVSSKPSYRQTVQTEEFVPPPAPADFKADWCFTNKALRLMWNFPVNPQRDIKKFQIFRRPTIEEPFQLIKEFDFDDSVIASNNPETPAPELITKLSSPQTYYIDRDFTKESSFIYAICAVDAHGFSSGYSTQFQVTFNRFRNRVEKNLISKSGAPKAYPNAFLNQDTFVDSIRSSGNKKLKVYFNPEYLRATDSANNDLKLIRTDNSAEYRFLLINVDLQQQKVVKVKIQDRRTTEEKLKT